MRKFILIALFLSLFSFTPVRGIAFADAVVTLQNGGGSLISGTKRYTLAEGYKLTAGDIIELNENSMTQIEFSSGAAFALSGESRAMLFPEENGIIALFLLRGMIKADAAAGGVSMKIETPLFAMSLSGATAVGIVTVNEAKVFAETGEVKLFQGNTIKTVKNGTYCTFKSDLNNAEISGLPKSFIELLPVEFKDALPNLLPEFKHRRVPLSESREFSYNEVEPWVDCVPSVRSLLVVYWKSKAKDRHFRKSLIQGLKKHPEWKGVLFPSTSRSKR